ncbi:MAG: GTP-binding protein [Bacteroidales bacterium]|nr:GTP-binding protein [Bacteroidales bacterium]
MTQNGYLDMQLLRFTTAGSVDDGKSTLIGRLLYDSKSIFEDQLEAVEQASKSRGNEDVNLALLTDGLKAEREQGITIDVAYRYFATPKRKFIIADTPGHIQYTRNMVTGASTADLAIILIDARHGVMEQTIRHSYIATLLGISRIVVCVNKMDLVDFSKDVFNKIIADYKEMSKHLDIPDTDFIPISAKNGDNVVNKSQNTAWYTGKPLLEYLETVEIKKSENQDFRMAVQYVVRPISDKFADFRGYAGRIAQGVLHIGDKIKVLPSGTVSTVKGIYNGTQELNEAQENESVNITLNDDIDISRGDFLVTDNTTLPKVDNQFVINICWFNSSPMQLRKKYIVRHATQEVQGLFTAIDFKTDISTQEKIHNINELQLNDIAQVQLKTANPLVFESYKQNKVLGSLIFVDPFSFETVGAGMII